MTIELIVEGKAIGQKQPIFSDWRVDLPPLDASRGDHLRLRELITAIVAKEVDGFNSRQEERKLARVMSKDAIALSATQGKVDPGDRDLQQKADAGEAIGVALQAFEDGLYFVFVDGAQETSLDREVFVQPNSKVLFLRLTALAGG